MSNHMWSKSNLFDVVWLIFFSIKSGIRTNQNNNSSHLFLILYIYFHLLIDLNLRIFLRIIRCFLNYTKNVVLVHNITIDKPQGRKLLVNHLSHAICFCSTAVDGLWGWRRGSRQWRTRTRGCRRRDWRMLATASRGSREIVKERVVDSYLDRSNMSMGVPIRQ